ncbi:MAG: hypothetical protein AAF387_04605 [Pseudomonadota bacterium]
MGKRKPPKHIEQREYGLSHYDFFRILPRVWPQHESLGELQVKIPLSDDGTVTISLSAEKYRRLATLKIPYVDIEYCFEQVPSSQRIEFFEKFDTSFQKGGG